MVHTVEKYRCHALNSSRQTCSERIFQLARRILQLKHLRRKARKSLIDFSLQKILVVSEKSLETKHSHFCNRPRTCNVASRSQFRCSFPKKRQGSFCAVYEGPKSSDLEPISNVSGNTANNKINPPTTIVAPCEIITK